MKQKILIVDDNQDSLDLMQEMLEPHGYEVECATSGPTAILQLQESVPDLVILDIMMPDMNGFAVLDVMRATPALERIPVIFQTAFPSQDHGRRTVDAGESYMLCKPLDADLFVNVVQRCLSEGTAYNKTKTAVQTSVQSTSGLSEMA